MWITSASQPDHQINAPSRGPKTSARRNPNHQPIDAPGQWGYAPPGEYSPSPRPNAPNPPHEHQNPPTTSAPPSPGLTTRAAKPETLVLRSRGLKGLGMDHRHQPPNSGSTPDRISSQSQRRVTASPLLSHGDAKSFLSSRL